MPKSQKSASLEMHLATTGSGAELDNFQTGDSCIPLTPSKLVLPKTSQISEQSQKNQFPEEELLFPNDLTPASEVNEAPPCCENSNSGDIMHDFRNGEEALENASRVGNVNDKSPLDSTCFEGCSATSSPEKQDVSKRKKHRPRVVMENPKIKRKYIRKNKVTETQNTDVGEASNTNDNLKTAALATEKSCKPALNFDHGLEIRIESKSMVQMEGIEMVLDKTRMGDAYDLNRFMNKVLEEYISETEERAINPKTPEKSSPLERNMMDDVLNDHSRGKYRINSLNETHDEQGSNMNTIERIENQSTPCENSKGNRTRELKRGNLQNLEDKNAISGMHFTTIYKKKRTEKVNCEIISQGVASRMDSRGKKLNLECGLGTDQKGKMKKNRSEVPIFGDMQMCGSLKQSPKSIEAMIAETHAAMKKKKRTRRLNFTTCTSTGVLKKKHSSVEEITDLLKGLCIDTERSQERKQQKNELIPINFRFEGQNELYLYQIDGTIVPFEGPFDPVKKRKPRPKVDIDEETDRVWRLLLEDINSEGIDGTDDEKVKWWEEERRVFQGRADSFIARMHLVQGDRRFSPWKGSVLDSVVGAFLTQNVSDHLSSSAFMALAARYPRHSKSSTSPSSDKGTTTVPKEPGLCIFDLEDTINCQGENTNCIAMIEVNGNESPGRSSSSKKPAGNMKSNFLGIFGRGLQIDNRTISDRFTYKREEVTAESSLKVINVSSASSSKTKEKIKKLKQSTVNWDYLRVEAQAGGKIRERTASTMDSLDWEAVRCADADEIADTIKIRGQNFRLADRIQDFLNRLVKDHGNNDLEWLRDVPPDKAKEYLLSVYGMGLKSVECVRLLSLHHLAFPVDTNVGRVAVRLGWVPLQPLPESLQLHLLELYPVLESIQRYLWPRLCKLDQKTLYELHYQLITFGKVFCTKSKPNCNACPMRGECRHFASAFASSRLPLPAPEENSIVTAAENNTAYKNPMGTAQQLQFNSVPIIEVPSTPEPIVEVPATPEFEEPPQIPDIEDAFWEDPDEIPTIKLNISEFAQNLQNYMHQNMGLQEGDVSKALVALTPEVASIPTPKLKNVSRLRTEHQVYELPDSHPLLKGMDNREPDDPCSYLLAIWTPGEMADSITPPKGKCSGQEFGDLCNESTCFSCNSIREANIQIVRGTLLIPCRTAMRGSFPLNGTYFQVNEVFADHASSLNPIDVPRAWIWNLPRRTVYFGTSIPSIFKGQSMESIQHCFWRGYVCVRGFDQKTCGPRPLMARLHFPASKASRTQKAMPNK